MAKELFLSVKLKCIELIENVKHYIFNILTVVYCHHHAIGGGPGCCISYTLKVNTKLCHKKGCVK